MVETSSPPPAGDPAENKTFLVTPDGAIDIGDPNHPGWAQVRERNSNRAFNHLVEHSDDVGNELHGMITQELFAADERAAQEAANPESHDDTLYLVRPQGTFNVDTLADDPRWQAAKEGDLERRIQQAAQRLIDEAASPLPDKQEADAPWSPPQANLPKSPEEGAALTRELAKVLADDATRFTVHAADSTGKRATSATLRTYGANVDFRTPAIQEGFAAGEVVLLRFGEGVGDRMLLYAFNGRSYVPLHGHDTPSHYDYRDPTVFKIGVHGQLGHPQTPSNQSRLSEIILAPTMVDALVASGQVQLPPDDYRTTRTATPNPFPDASWRVRGYEELPKQQS